MLIEIDKTHHINPELITHTEYVNVSLQLSDHEKNYTLIGLVSGKFLHISTPTKEDYHNLMSMIKTASR